MGAKISKRYSSYKPLPKAFKHFLNFLPNGPHKTLFGIFEILKIEILHFFSFLALLDYVSRAHEIAICLSSVVHLSSVRVAIISEPNARISFKF